MHFNILFVVAFICVCACVQGHESAYVLMVVQYVCALALKVYMNSLITIAPVKGKLGQFTRFAVGREEVTSTQIPLTRQSEIYQEKAYLTVLKSSQKPFIRNGYSNPNTVESNTDRSLKLVVFCCSTSQTLLKDSCGMSAKSSSYLVLTRCQMVCINSEWFW